MKNRTRDEKGRFIKEFTVARIKEAIREDEQELEDIRKKAAALKKVLRGLKAKGSEWGVK